MKRDPLADVPPGEFVRRRNELVKELRAAGKTAEARALAARRRPSPALWAVNQVARAEPERVARLIAAGKAVAAAQRGLLRGGAADGLRDAEAELRAAIGAVEEKLDGVSNAAAQRRALDTLRAAVLGGDASRKALREGALEEELDPGSGFEALGDVKVLPRKRKPEPKPPKPPRPSKAEERARRRREAQLAKLRAAAEKAERRAQELRARAEEAAAAPPT